MNLTNKQYDTIKLIGLIAVPVIVFLSAVVSILDFPGADKVTAILAALDVLIGSVVTILKSLYEKKQKDQESKEGDPND